jgi:hypothetical protein
LAIQLATADGIEVVRREIEFQAKLDSCRGCRRPSDDIGFDLASQTAFIYARRLTQDEGGFGLRSYLANPTQFKALTKANIFQIMASVVLALQDLHSKGIPHGDIKPENSMFISC